MSKPDPRRPSFEPSPEEEERARARAELGIRRLEGDEELIDDDTFQRLHARLAAGRAESLGADGEDELWLDETVAELPLDVPVDPDASVAALEPPADPADAAALEAALGAAQERSEVVELALRLALGHARSVGLLVVNRGIVAGLRGHGDGIESRIPGVVLSAEAGSLFASCVQTGKPYRGVVPERGPDAQIMRALGRADAAEILILPVEIRERVVNLLYADNGPSVLAETSVAALATLCRCVSASYERLILTRKRGG